jgi:DNA-binding HxlR family transcriptional regulator
MSELLNQPRKVCPIGLASELVCDKWIPIILRDIGLFERRSFNQILKYNLEGISSGSLAAKLKRLEHVGLIRFEKVSEHRQKKLYYLTQSGIDFLPVLFAMAAWSAKWHQPTKKYAAMIESYVTSPGSKMQELQTRLLALIPNEPAVNSSLKP